MTTKKLLINYQLDHGKKLKPIRRHKKSKSKVPNTITCPHCGAPHIYIYDNNGGKGQFQCKICNCNFSYKNRFSKAAIIRCPHCNKPLEKLKLARISLFLNVKIIVVLIIFLNYPV